MFAPSVLTSSGDTALLGSKYTFNNLFAKSGVFMISVSFPWCAIASDPSSSHTNDNSSPFCIVPLAFALFKPSLNSLIESGLRPSEINVKVMK